MTRRGLWILVGLIAAGIVVRVVLAFAQYGNRYDITSLQIVADRLDTYPGHVYETDRWPYPGGFFPLIVLADRVSLHTGLAFSSLIKLPAILADAGLAWLVQDVLRRHGGGERARLFGAGLVALGPSFILISGYHGQIDAAAILPAALGVALWDRDVPRRALLAGVLIGLGASVKTVPLFLVLALLPTARDWPERLWLCLPAAVIPALSVLPFALVDPSSTIDALRVNHGIPAFGGISSLVQPALTEGWVDRTPLPPLNGVERFLFDQQNLIVGLAALAAGVVLIVKRVPPLQGAVVLWLAVYAANPNFAFQYMIWGLPFFLMAGHLRAVAALQAALLLPEVLLYEQTAVDDVLAWSYVPFMAGLVVVSFVALALALRGVLRAPRPPAPAPT